jgi:hypothetical protein
MLVATMILAIFAFLTNDYQFGAQPKIPVLWIFSIVANATAAFRLYQLELSHIYRHFFGGGLIVAP